MGESSMVWVWIGVAFFVGLPAVVAGLQLIAFTTAKVERVEGRDRDALHQAAEREIGRGFFEGKAFRFVGAYRLKTFMGRPAAVMWQHGGEGTYLAALLVAGAKQIHTDIVSILSWERGIGVTTATAKDGHVVPKPPGAWMQSFSGVTTAVLWERHQEAEAAVADHYGVTPEPFTLDPGEVLLRSVRRDAVYNLTHPWLLGVIVWRFWIGKHLLHGKRVAERLG